MDVYGIFDPEVTSHWLREQRVHGHGDDDLVYLYSLPHIPDLDRHVGDKTLGHDAVIQTFYEGPKKCDCCQNWVQKMPTQLPKSEKGKFDRAAILLFKGKNHKSSNATVGGLVALEDCFLEIQSSIITNLIRPFLAKQGVLAPRNKKITIKSPFAELFHSYTDIIMLKASLDPMNPQYSHLQLLVNVMDDLFSEFAPKIRELHKRKIISCQHLWTIFSKGMIVYTRRDGHDRLLRVHRIEATYYWRSHEVRYWKLTCRYIQFDGVRFGWVDQVHYIEGFEGIQHITDLHIYPLGFHPDKQLEQRARDQGRLILDYQGISHCEYLGRGMTKLQGTTDPDDDEDLELELRRLQGRPIESFQITGRVIVDAYGFKKYNPGISPEVLPMDTPGVDDDGSEIRQPSSLEPSGRKRFEAFENGRLTSGEQELNKEAFLKEPENLFLLCPLLPGYSLRKNMWLWLSITSLRSIKWNPTAMDMLVIPEKRKNLLSTFVRHHSSVGQNHGDVVSGKGRGFIVMLSGPPGTGKTLTAEAVAEKAQKPLFRLQAENMGFDAQFAQNLARAFDLATEWGAVLLVDEADAFLGQRSIQNPSRNGLISVMLRQLEYYQGIMFLTTNLAEQIDDAFRSRIHLHLCYSLLTIETRQSIWTNYLKRVEGLCEKLKQPPRPAANRNGRTDPGLVYRINPSDFESLALWNLTGREIKNVVKTVYLWSRYNGFEISLERIEDGIELTAPFATRSRRSIRSISDGDDDSGHSAKRQRTT